ncbi:MAG: hypothetical protein H0V24_16800 [Chloroflexia bacterium]|nr:hypothetical protein [Chloroflexia bacterium]MDQ3411743.1 hypothetical protein [Chloroflexota bacterium]
MAGTIRELLDYIVVHYAVEDEQKDVDLNASAVESGSEIESEKRDVAQREIDRAEELADPFARGLVAAYRASQAGATEIVLDDRDPEENRMADALIGFLVSYELATSRTEETDPMQYRYFVTVNWDRLQPVARAAGVDLTSALAP